MTTSEISQIEMDQLAAIRDDIDRIDSEIQRLISDRAECAQKVADIKTQGGQVEAVFYRPEREAQVLRAVKDRNNSLISGDDMARLFREIMSVCLALEQPMRVAYLGPEGSFSHSSVLKQFGSFAHPYAVSTIEEVFESVGKGEVNYGMVPVENSTEGVVKQTQNELISTNLQVTGEVELPINHCLLALTKNAAEITKILAHPQALGQCEQWLKNNHPTIETQSCDSNAKAAMLAMNNPNIAAIASEQAANLYGLHILEKNIEDQKNNTTKFWVIGKEGTLPSGEDKTAMIVSVPNESGALLKIMDSFAKREISMTRVISVPAKQVSNHSKWDYLFFIDVLGHQQDSELSEALNEVVENTSFCKLLGSFPISPMG